MTRHCLIVQGIGRGQCRIWNCSTELTPKWLNFAFSFVRRKPCRVFLDTSKLTLEAIRPLQWWFKILHLSWSNNIVQMADEIFWVLVTFTFMGHIDGLGQDCSTVSPLLLMDWRYCSLALSHRADQNLANSGASSVRYSTSTNHSMSDTGLILGLRPANERRLYKVTPSLIGWAQT